MNRGLKFDYFYYNPNNCPLNGELSIKKKNAFQKFAHFIILEHRRIVSVEREMRFKGGGCYVK